MLLVFYFSPASALKTFREQIHEDPKRIFSSWDLQVENPCNWSGIACSPDGGHVIKLYVRFLCFVALLLFLCSVFSYYSLDLRHCIGFDVAVTFLGHC